MAVPQSLRVFISSKDALGDERATVEDALKAIATLPVRVETPTHVATGVSDEYLQEVLRSHLVVLILELGAPGEDDADSYYRYVEAEVDAAFGAGKTVLVFVKETSSSEADEFLKKVQKRAFRHDFRDCVQLRESVQASVLNEVYKRYRSAPKVFTSKRETYRWAAGVLGTCTARVHLCQSTPTLLLGPRKQRDYEEKLFREVQELLLRNSESSTPIEIAILFNAEALRTELSERLSDYDVDCMAENISFLRRVAGQSVYVADADDEVPFVVADHTYLIGYPGKKRFLAVADRSPVVVAELAHLVDHATSTSGQHGIDLFEKLLREYGH